MHSFRHFLTEVFDKPVSYFRKGLCEWLFEVDNVGYCVDIVDVPYVGVGIVHTVEFSNDSNGIIRQSHTVPRDRIVAHTHKVFATVAEILGKYIETSVKSGERVSFESSDAPDLESSQIKLYTTLARKLASKFNMVNKSIPDVGEFELIKR